MRQSKGKGRTPRRFPKVSISRFKALISSLTIIHRIILGSPMITIACGSNALQPKERFQVHRYLIMLFSSELRLEEQALAKGDSPTCLQLENVQPSTFASYISWIYGGRLFPGFSKPEYPAYGFGGEAEEPWQLGERLGDTRCSNQCMDNIRIIAKIFQPRRHRFKSAWPTVFVAKWVYRFTEKGCLLRKFVADVLVFSNP